MLRANNSVPHSNGSQGDIKVPNSLLEKLTAEVRNEKLLRHTHILVLAIVWCVFVHATDFVHWSTCEFVISMCAVRVYHQPCVNLDNSYVWCVIVLQFCFKPLSLLLSQDWNELVSFLCSYMEKSLQSSIVEQFRQIQASRPATSDSSGSSTEEITNHERQRPTRAESVKHRRHTSRKARPLSMPSFPHDIMHHQHHPHRRGCKTSTSPVDISIDDNCPAEQDRLRACSSPQRLQTTCAGSPSTNRHKNGRVLPHRTTSATNTDELLRMATAAIEQEMNAAQGNYLTLAQLKDLGLSLRREQPNKGKEDNSQFSMQCWPSTEVDCLMRHRRQRPRKKRSRKIVGQTSKQNFQAESPNRETGQIADLEHVCYLGPEPIDSGRDSPATNMAVADLQTKPATKDVDKVIVGNKDLQEMCSQEENQPACYGVMHLHQHSHHHFHHVIHHSLSQSPEEPCSASSPDVPLSQ